MLQELDGLRRWVDVGPSGLTGERRPLAPAAADLMTESGLC